MAYDQLKLENQLCFRLYTASRLITQAYDPFFKPLGITYTQYLVLMVLWEQDNMPVNDIGKRLMLGINTMSPLIKRMESMRLLSRKASETDKRQQIVFLTDKGKALEAEAAKISNCIVDLFGASELDANKIASGMIPLLEELIEKLSANNK